MLSLLQACCCGMVCPIGRMKRLPLSLRYNHLRHMKSDRRENETFLQEGGLQATCCAPESHLGRRRLALQAAAFNRSGKGCDVVMWLCG
jgi:hypothetical protein